MSKNKSDLDNSCFASLRYAEARARYEQLRLKNTHQAEEYALRAAPFFPAHQFFYNKLLSEGVDPEVRRRAAISALKMAEAGVDINYKILIRAEMVLDSTFEIARAPHALEARRNQKLVKGASSLLAEVYRAKKERRWNDAYKVLEQYVESHPQDIRRTIELGLLAYRSGSWGERISAILALHDYPHDKKARDAFETVQSFFQACSIPMSSRQDSEQRETLQSPGSVFRHVLDSCPASRKEKRAGVVMIVPSLAGGGAERIAATICNGLLTKGRSVEMAIYEVSNASGRDPLFYLPTTGLSTKDIQVLDLSSDLREPFKWLPPNLSRKSQAIHDFLIERRPRTLYLTLDMANLAGGFAAVIAGVPNIVLHCHNQRPSSVYANLGIEGWAAAYHALLKREEVRIIAVSQTVSDDYIDWTGAQLGKIEVVRNGLDLRQLMKPDKPFIRAFKTELGIPQASLVVGAAFRFEEVKRPDLWLRMAQQVGRERQDVHFVLFGEGALLDAAQLQCRELGLKDRVHFTGHINDLYRRLPLLDIFVLSSRSEGLPNVLLEAQAAGVIPIAFDVGGCRETMIDGVTGHLVHEQSAEALANVVLKVLSDSEWRGAARKCGKKFVRSQFSARRMQASFGRLLRS